MSNETISALQVALDTIRDETRHTPALDAETNAAIVTLRALIALGNHVGVVGRANAVDLAVEALNEVFAR